MGSPYRDDNSCPLCLSCLRGCPTQAIALAQKRIIEAQCIHCGVCQFICPQQHYHSDNLTELEETLNRWGKKIALISGLIGGAVIEYEPEKIAGALNQLGFEEVYLADFGLKMIAQAYQELLGNFQNPPLIFSHCPAVVEYVEKFYPDLISHLAPVISPELASLKYLSELKKGAHLVLVSACPPRKEELTKNLMDYPLITFPELKQFFIMRKIDLGKVPAKQFQTLPLPAENSFIAEGDLVKAVLEDSSKALVASGMEEIQRILNCIRLGEFRDKLVELNFCKGGCIGSLAITNHLSLIRRKELAKNYLQARKEVEQSRLRLVPNLKIKLECQFNARRVQLLEPNPEKIKLALNNLGFDSDFPKLNCKICGYPSCEEFAKALLRNEVEPNYCFPSLLRNMSRLDERFLRSERLASVGQMAVTLAHEINNPLGLASGYVQTLLSNKKLSKEIKEVLNLIREGIEDAANIIQNLLTLSRDRPLSFSLNNLYDVIGATLRLIAPKLETSGIFLNLDYIPEPLFIECDPQALQQVFTNLLLNAWQAMPAGGTLSISVQTQPGQVIISFKDTGVGIKPEHLPRLFDPFFTTKAPGEGTGLGLAIVYKIIESHKGDIQVRSDTGKGAEFIISLPLSQGQTEQRKSKDG